MQTLTNPYDSLYHHANECRNDHPTLYKVPVGFRGFHVEDYDEEMVDEWEREANTTW